MKRLFLASSVALPCLIAAGLNCSADDSVVLHPTTTTGGTTSAGTAGSATTSTTAGSSTTSTTSGGAATTTTTVGAGGNPGSTTVGAGGMGGAAGGAGGAATGAGGNAGGAAGAGGAGVICSGDCTTVLGKMDGFLVADPATSVAGSDGIQSVGNNNGTPTAVCVSTEARADHGLYFKRAHWQLTGPGITVGTVYQVTFHVVGVVECKTYANSGCPKGGNLGGDAFFDMWCPAATDNGDHWNTFMISVTPTMSATTPGMGPMDGPLPTAGNFYMMNQCPNTIAEAHRTYKIDYEKTINVPGGSFINYVEFDTNCREIINCGASLDSGVTCTAHHSITNNAAIQAAVPAAPASLNTQPFAAGGGAFGQWVFFDVKSVTP